MKQFLMGNEAIALGACHAGVRLVAGYPGTPSTEILESVAKQKDPDIYVEWSVNEKAALEVAAGAAYSGARTMVTMKQVGLNVASDPLMSLAYVGVKGGMVVVVADDPGPISSQTEQDTRTFASYSKLPVFDPSSPEEAYQMIQDAFTLSEEEGTPVLFRPTTRVCHSCADIEVLDQKPAFPAPEGFIRDTARFVIFPKASYQNHLRIEKRNPLIGKRFSSYRYNTLTGKGKKALVTGGISTAYAKEALLGYDGEFRHLCVATPFPFPEELGRKLLNEVDEVLVLEELDPVLEKALIFLCGKYHFDVAIHGKLDGFVPAAGENSVEILKNAMYEFFDDFPRPSRPEAVLEDLPVRPPVLCAGCPHRASFYAVKQAMKGRKAVFCGDIGCYTLGNAMPLDMVDTCLCMGADVTIAQGIRRVDPDTTCFSFIGDSTFFASGITGVVNAVYNQSDIILIVLDNSTTAMTGHQPHPGTGQTMMGTISEKISIEKILTAIGVTSVQTVDPLNYKAAVKAVADAAKEKGVRAIIFRSPCIAVVKPEKPVVIDREKCVGCKKCIRDLGCPALMMNDNKASVEESLCTGCGLCAQICPTSAISKEGK